ncbi:MAG: NAD(P)H-dependent oxidoreductase subunit E, partial [Eubacteriales bacterium]|nr:NAD(P)H-dependent oxidoreductase subunit E [Eubacteriales bacterium]
WLCYDNRNKSYSSGCMDGPVKGGTVGKIKVEVCAGTFCTMMGSMDIAAAIESLTELEESGIQCDLDVTMIPCLENCESGALSPVVRINGEVFLRAETETVMAKLLELTQKCPDAGDSQKQEQAGR